MKNVKAVIADDEEHLRQFLKKRLAEVWPELVICAEAANGKQALDLIDAHRPDIAFLDIRMPGLTGMEVARRVSGACRVVFVTAYDQYAVEAFENEAVDYLLKPVTSERLEKTARRLKEKMESHASPPRLPDDMMNRLLAAVSRGQSRRYTQYIRVQHGDGIRLIPSDEVIYFKASDKYTLVITREGEFLIRKAIRELIDELDPEKFWQIHRGTIVHVRHIAGVTRSLTGKGALRLRDREEILKVSSRYMHLFKQM